MALDELTNKLYSAVKGIKNFIIFEQERPGINGRRFTLYKFRTMYNGSEDMQSQLAMERGKDRFGHIANDPRVIPIIGNFMRKTRLDELPQIYNIIRGDMVLFGPRPIHLYDYNEITIEQRELRELFNPGLIPINLFADYLIIHSAEDLRASDHRYNAQRLVDPLTPLKYIMLLFAAPIRYMKTLYNSSHPIP